MGTSLVSKEVPLRRFHSRKGRGCPISPRWCSKALSEPNKLSVKRIGVSLPDLAEMVFWGGTPSWPTVPANEEKKGE